MIRLETITAINKEFQTPNGCFSFRCDGFDSCAVNISSNLFGDPCPSTPKYLEVHYGCVPTSTTTTRKPLPPWFLEVAGKYLDRYVDIWIRQGFITLVPKLS